MKDVALEGPPKKRRKQVVSDDEKEADEPVKVQPEASTSAVALDTSTADAINKTLTKDVEADEVRYCLNNKKPSIPSANNGVPHRKAILKCPCLLMNRLHQSGERRYSFL